MIGVLIRRVDELVQDAERLQGDALAYGVRPPVTVLASALDFLPRDGCLGSD